ncbi:phosphodiesterase [Streptomyces sp. NPDC000983]|uniref:phosphodiesterase n=1 Tax=Streptomyces sp. NPDC000983 TaxID=3154373 RepID=UPI0033174F17
MSLPIAESARRVARRVGHWRAAPALHPHGVLCSGTLDVPGRTSSPPWGAPWLDEPRSHTVTVRWSRALGLPRPLPDGLGLAVRVIDADGPGRPLDLIFTSSGSGRLGRHVPLLRPDALAGPYSTLMSYRVGERECVLAAFPDSDGPAKGAVEPTLWQKLACRPVRFALRAAATDEVWRTFATLSLEAVVGAPAWGTVSYDPYAHGLPDLHPTERLRRLREAAYAGSRHGRAAAGGAAFEADVSSPE